MKYYGNKYKLLNFIGYGLDSIGYLNNRDANVLDLFSGSCSVGKYFKTLGYGVSSCDKLYFSYVLMRCYIGLNKVPLFSGLGGIDRVFSILNTLDGYDGIITDNYSEKFNIINKTKNLRLFFTYDDARRIDGIRDLIEEWYNKANINEDEYFYLLTCLIHSISRVINTSGHMSTPFKTFFKDIEFILKPVEIIDNGKDNKCYNMDSLDLLSKIDDKFDIIYADPPYNRKQYILEYFLMELIITYDYKRIRIPSLDESISGVVYDTTKRSDFSNKNVYKAFTNLLIRSSKKTKYLIISYSDEGLVPIDELIELCSEYGQLKFLKSEYKRYATKITDKQKKSVYEYLLIVDFN